MSAPMTAAIATSSAANAAEKQAPPMPGDGAAAAVQPAAAAVVPGPSPLAKMIAGYVRLGADGLADALEFKGWAVSEAEALQIGGDVDDVLKKYFPEGGDGPVPPELRLAVSLAGIFGVRWYFYKKAMREKAAAAEADAKANTAAGGGSSSNPPTIAR